MAALRTAAGRLRGKTVLIVGGASLVGGCLVRRFMQLNANVIVWDSQKKKLDQLLREFGCTNEKEEQAETRECSPSGDTPKKLKGGEMGAGTQLTANLVDLTNRVQLQRVAKLLGPVHVVVNVADACVSRHFFERNDESSERILLGNVLSSIVLARALLPGMLRQKDGHFVTITNAAGVVGVARHPDYAASHWASVGAHESLQMMIREMGGSGKVRTTLFCLCSDLRVAPAVSYVSTSDDNKVVGDKMDPKSPTGSLLVVSPFCKRPVTPRRRGGALHLGRTSWRGESVHATYFCLISATSRIACAVAYVDDFSACVVEAFTQELRPTCRLPATLKDEEGVRMCR
ncbi:hypothetical protein C3747_114g51 [Trypanosoma cruzi]|uniref:Short-chain dehydrogenase n=1 Tax=Trypanosoma cruzi TaxID=5693 RepID=A0A2V2WCY0_TRYCR|nr:hypothetical protein C3747_114g51 [Trypanosoma cruzi]